MIRHKRTKRGRGIFDWFKPVMSLVNTAIENKEAAKDVVNIGENTREIIKEIKAKKSDNNEIANIVNRLNKLKHVENRQRAVGSGFAWI